MSDEIKIPPLGESVTEATVGSFLKESGAFVHEGDEVVELETEKVNQVLYAPRTGVLTWSVGQGTTVKVGDVIGHIEEKKGEKPPPSQSPSKKKEELASPVPPPEEEKSVPEGRETRRPLSKIRKVIAHRLVEALRTSAMLTTFNEIDMTVVMEKRKELQEAFTQKHGVKLGLTSFFVQAVTEAIASFPDLNAYLDGEELVLRHYCDIGVAVGGAKGGLVVPVVRACEKKSFPEIEKEIARLATAARTGKLSVDQVEGGGFTITNGGVYGSLLSTPILNPPQTAILGLHKIEKRAVVIDDQIVIRPMMYVALSYDHRVIDGKEAVTFLVRLKELLEDAKTWTKIKI